MRTLWLVLISSLPVAGNLLAAEIDDEFLPAMAYMACAASPDRVPGENPEMAKHALCDFVKGLCKADPGSSDCEKVVTKYRVRELAEDKSFVLYTAAWAGNVPIVSAMLAGGADPNATIAGQASWTPLMIAAAEGRQAAVSALLTAGAEPNRQNNFGRTALMFAGSYGFTDIARELLDHGADPNIVPADATGWTALIAAACNGRAEATRLLLDRGADPAAEDKSGNTALACARKNRHSEVVSILRAQEPR